jgi:hypothetical protein
LLTDVAKNGLRRWGRKDRFDFLPHPVIDPLDERPVDLDA